MSDISQIAIGAVAVAVGKGQSVAEQRAIARQMMTMSAAALERVGGADEACALAARLAHKFARRVPRGK
jgi:hypothetical protein